MLSGVTLDLDTFIDSIRLRRTLGAAQSVGVSLDDGYRIVLLRLMQTPTPRRSLHLAW